MPNSKDTLPSGQARVLAYLRDFIRDQGRPPTQAEIARGLGFASRTAAKDHLRALQKKGYLDLDLGSARGIRLKGDAPPVPLQDSPLALSLPLVGRVAAGSPLLAVENIEGHHMIDPALFSPRADYLLRVSGLSMRGAGILDGDLLAVHRTPEAQDGQIVVARIEDEVTVKRFERHGREVHLIAANPDFEPLVVDLRRQDFSIEGRAVGVIRSDLP